MFFDRFRDVFQPFSDVRIFRRGFGEAVGGGAAAATPQRRRGVAAASPPRRRRSVAATADFAVPFLENVY